MVGDTINEYRLTLLMSAASCGKTGCGSLRCRCLFRKGLDSQRVAFPSVKFGLLPDVFEFGLLPDEFEFGLLPDMFEFGL